MTRSRVSLQRRLYQATFGKTFSGSESIPFQPPHHLVELIEAAIVDLQHAALAAVVDGHGETERVREPPLERDRVGVLDRALLDRPARSLRALLGQRLDLADIEPAIH